MRSLLFLVCLLIIGCAAIFAQSSGDVSTDGSSQASTTTTVNNAALPQTRNSYVRPNSKTRFNRYVMSMLGPVALGKYVVSAGWGTWRNSPSEWGDHWDGFGKRVASSFGKGIIKNTTIYSLDEALKIDSHYYRSTNKGIKARISNALLSTVAARNRDGKRVIGVPRIAGIYAAALVAENTWYPARYGWKSGLKSGTYSIGLEAAFNLVKEFIWKK